MAFVCTGDPDVETEDNLQQWTLVRGESGYSGDTLRGTWQQDYWRRELSHRPASFVDRLFAGPIIYQQMTTRFMTLGLAVRQNIPLFTARSRTKDWLDALVDTTGTEH